MRTPALLRRILAAAALAAAPLAAAAGDGPLPAPLERAADTWSGHALADEEAARRGREALPFTQDQIETLGRLLRETQQAAARGAGAPPRGRVRRVRLDGAGEVIPAIRLRRGYVTAVSFSDMTGAPWPIEEALVGRPGSRDAQGRRREDRCASHGDCRTMNMMAVGSATNPRPPRRRPRLLPPWSTAGRRDHRSWLELRRWPLAVLSPEVRSTAAPARRCCPSRKGWAAARCGCATRTSKTPTIGAMWRSRARRGCPWKIRAP